MSDSGVLVSGRDPRHSLAAVASVGVAVAALAIPLWETVGYSLRHDLHSHVVLVPFVVAFLLWVQREVLPQSVHPSPGLAAILGALALLAFATLWAGPGQSDGNRAALVAFGAVSLMWAGGFLFLGRDWMRAACFPMGFLIFMVPMPQIVAHGVESLLMHASAGVSQAMFFLTGIPHVRSGLVFHLPGIAIEVAPECSGIRSTWVLFLTSVLGAWMFLRSSWRRLLLVAVVVPLGILRNGIRICTIGWLCVEYGPEMIDGFIHRRGGPAFFLISLIPLALIVWVLRKGDRPAQSTSHPRTHRETISLNGNSPKPSNY